MMPLTKVYVFMALTCPAVALAQPEDCEGYCPEKDDETSLMQVKKAVHYGNERAAPEAAADQPWIPVNNPWVTWDAEVKSMPDHLDKGSVTKAYESNKAKERSEIEAPFDKKLAFEKKVVEERRLSREEAEKRVAADKVAVEKAIAADKKAVEAVLAKKRAVEKEAQETVEHAKEEWEAHDIKKHQAEKYAIEGRYQGEHDALGEVRRKQIAAREAAEEARLARIRAEEKEAEAKRLQAERDAINRVTHAKELADKAYADRAAKAAREAEEHAAGKTAIAEEIIEGAEAMKNRLVREAADREAEDYGRRVASDQHRINEADAAHWPKDFWPEPRNILPDPEAFVNR